MTPEIVAELIARRESPTLDFKADQYDWRADGNLELAKDLMAVANSLGPGSACGYILIGVEEEPDQTGRLTGIDVSKHLDDAAMHEKVKFLLNRCPDFQYAAIDVEGHSVGVFEIRPGGRPYYPLKTRGARHKLSRFEARIRVGSFTDVASPEQIQAWAREDDAESRELRRIDLELREAQLVVRPAVSILGASYREDQNFGNDEIVNTVAVHNVGEARFHVASAVQTWTLTDAFYAAANAPIGRRAPEPLIIRRPPAAPVPVGPALWSSFEVSLSAVDLGEYIQSACGIGIASTQWYEWVEGSITVECSGATGRLGLATVAVNMEALRAEIERRRDIAAAERAAAFDARRSR
jgi:hypothetical protein